MDSARALELLDRLDHRGDVLAVPAEVDELDRVGLVRRFDVGARDQLSAKASGLGVLAERARALQRQLDASPQDVVGGDGRREDDLRAELRDILVRLEELTRLKANLDALVWNEPTGTYLRLTLDGRRTLFDLRAWIVRYHGVPFAEFLAQMSEFRAELANKVVRAAFLLKELAPRGAEELHTDLRPIALMLAGHRLDPLRAAADYRRYVSDLAGGSHERRGRQMAAALLASIPGEEVTIEANFRAIRAALADRVPSLDDEVVAASLADLPQDQWAGVLNRLPSLRASLPDVQRPGLVVLARSPYPLEELPNRFEAAKALLREHGPVDFEGSNAGAAILAGAPWSTDALSERLKRMYPELRAAFDPAHVPASMLASGTLGIDESLEVFREAVGAVTRANFFDMTLEVENLALLLVHGGGPEVARFFLTPSASPEEASMPVPALARDPGFSWFIYYNLWVHRPMITFLESHPAHMHTVYFYG